MHSTMTDPDYLITLLLYFVGDLVFRDVLLRWNPRQRLSLAPASQIAAADPMTMQTICAVRAASPPRNE